MPYYFIGVIVALACALLHAGANILDSYFSNKIFNRLATLIFISNIIGFIFLPFILFFNHPHYLALPILGIIFIIATIEILYQYPYYWSLRHTDTSIVTSLFSLGKILTPLLAFLIVGEHLSWYQYAGFFLIILSSSLLTFDLKKLRFNRAFLLMLLVSIILSVQAVLYKYVFDAGAGYGSVLLWVYLFGFVISSGSMFIPQNFNDFRTSSRKVKEYGFMFTITQLLSWGGEVAGTYALFLLPVSIYKGITSTQSIFVLVIALVFARKAPHLFREYLGKEGILKKVALFLMMIVGTVFVVS